MSNNYERPKGFLADAFYFIGKLVLGKKDYQKSEMIGRMMFEKDYFSKCNLSFEGKKEGLDVIVSDNYGNAWHTFSKK